jgi:plastocyanin
VFRPFILTIEFAAMLSCTACALLAADVSIKITDQKGQPVSDAVVSLTPLDAAVPPPAPQAEIPEIVQSKKQFSPFVTVVRTGTTVAFPNRDSIEHYLFSQSAAKAFQFPLYAPGKSEKVTFDKAGVVALGCDIHDTMIAYVIVVDTPWYARTGNTGMATIANVPAGRYRTQIWHARLQKIDQSEVAINGEGAVTSIIRQFELTPPRRTGPKLGGPGGGYR